ncbi:MAG: Holliday junction branch migration protein RuvA [Myxococcales bacterium]|nr:Holliday junction branch migration protein RuvA [Myxococcales bacterium]MCB9579042.1 Holliday junction branch migration protein RuvA [Polyangiaceae bacterium]
MIGRLTGRVVGEEPTGQLVIDIQGVGYEVMTPVGTRGRAKSAGDNLSFYTYLHVREDALELYGFASELERRVFRMLIDVPNVGPKTALGVLSALPVPELAQAVGANDLARLTRVPGIGKKTAERLALELREKLRGVTEVAALPEAPAASDDAKKLLSALTNMGYRAAEAERAVKALGKQVGSAPMADLLRAALRELNP